MMRILAEYGIDFEKRIRVRSCTYSAPLAQLIVQLVIMEAEEFRGDTAPGCRC